MVLMDVFQGHALTHRYQPVSQIVVGGHLSGSQVLLLIAPVPLQR
jgi:hypothetical protein